MGDSGWFFSSWFIYSGDESEPEPETRGPRKTHGERVPTKRGNASRPGHKNGPIDDVGG